MLEQCFRCGGREGAIPGSANRSWQCPPVSAGGAQAPTMPSIGATPFNSPSLLFGKLGVERAPPLEAVCFVLDRHSDPLFIVDPSRKLHFWNVSAKRVLETRQSLRLQRGRLSMGSPPDDRRLEELLQSMQSRVIGRAPSRASGRTGLVPSRGGSWRFIRWNRSTRRERARHCSCSTRYRDCTAVARWTPF